MSENFINNAKEIIPSVNDTPYKRILAVGDIHGKFNALKSLWKKLHVTDDDLVIFLGDYVDRGEGIANVLKWVINQSSARKNFIFLRGNHEQMMLNALTRTDGNRAVWLINGGQNTVFALRNLINNKIFTLNDIVNFAENLPLSYSITIGGRRYFFCHAGVNPKVSLDEQTETYLLWSREEFFVYYEDEPVIITGHSPIKFFFDFDANNPRPIKIPYKNIIMTDTGAFTRGGRLSAVDILSGQYWQSGEDVPNDILFVCSANCCRSPMAKYIMRHLLRFKRLDKKFSIESAGARTEGGSYMSEPAEDVLKANNVNYNLHISKQFTKHEYQNSKMIIALDSGILAKAKEISGGDPDNKIRLFKDLNGKEFDVADPWHGDDIEEAYKDAYKEIYLGCSALLKEIENG